MWHLHDKSSQRSKADDSSEGFASSRQPLAVDSGTGASVCTPHNTAPPLPIVFGGVRQSSIDALCRSQGSAASVTTFAGQLGCLLHRTHHVLGHSLGACAPTRSAAEARQCVVCATNMSAAVASLLAQATPQDPMATGSVGLRSTSTEDSFNTEKAKLRVSFGGQIVQVSRLWQLRCLSCPWLPFPGGVYTHSQGTPPHLR